MGITSVEERLHLSDEGVNGVKTWLTAIACVLAVAAGIFFLRWRWQHTR